MCLAVFAVWIIAANHPIIQACFTRHGVKKGPESPWSLKVGHHYYLSEFEIGSPGPHSKFKSGTCQTSPSIMNSFFSKYFIFCFLLIFFLFLNKIHCIIRAIWCHWILQMTLSAGWGGWFIWGHHWTPGIESKKRFHSSSFCVFVKKSLQVFHTIIVINF